MTPLTKLEQKLNDKLKFIQKQRQKNINFKWSFQALTNLLQNNIKWNENGLIENSKLSQEMTSNPFTNQFAIEYFSIHNPLRAFHTKPLLNSSLFIRIYEKKILS